MGKNWLCYLIGLGAAVVFHAYYFGWYSWFLLVLAVCLPWFSFLISLPAMLRVRLSLRTQERCLCGDPVYLTLQASNGFLPMPGCRFRLRLRSVMTGETAVLRQKTPGQDNWYLPLNTKHCGVVCCTAEKGRVYDYLGLFWLPIRCGQTAELMVFPQPVAPEKLPNLNRFLVRRKKPKPGGGFSEEHELRDYRPGDNLRDIHWKLSVKTDRLIVREAQEPVREMTLLTLDLCGTPNQVDRTLEQLLWMSQWLLEHDVEHHVMWIDPADCRIASAFVKDASDLDEVLCRLLRSALREDTPSIANRRFERVSWRYHIQPEQEVQS